MTIHRSVYLTIHSNCFLFLPPHRQMDALNSSRKRLHVHPVGWPNSLGQNQLAWDHPHSHWVSYLSEYISTLTCYQHAHSNHKGFFCQGKSVNYLNTTTLKKESCLLNLEQIALVISDITHVLWTCVQYYLHHYKLIVLISYALHGL